MKGVLQTVQLLLALAGIVTLSAGYAFWATAPMRSVENDFTRPVETEEIIPDELERDPCSPVSIRSLMREKSTPPNP